MDTEPKDYLSGEVYMIWCRKGRAPRKKHLTEESAVTEAQRLAVLHPGKKFYVLKALAKYQVEKETTE